MNMISVMAKRIHISVFTLSGVCLLWTMVNGKGTKIYPTDLKYILLWSNPDYAPLSYFGEGQVAFVVNNCSVKNCYVTTDKNLLHITYYDAIAFNGRFLQYKDPDVPTMRSPRQIYIYFNMESPAYVPVENYIYESYFNWTATYRLDSDIPYPYILIKNKHGDIVGPKIDMNWEDTDEGTLWNVNKSKYRAVASFMSNCESKSHRELVTNNLKNELAAYNLTLDIFGNCGTSACPRDDQESCNELLKSYYYFYLSFENSFDDDYVTEKLLIALRNDVVPIVYGGANYSRFLPPGSFLDAWKQSPKNLAYTIYQNIRWPERYQSFFNWRRHYTYHDPKEKENVCSVCAHLNNETLINTTKVYKYFRKWWNNDYSVIRLFSQIPRE